MKSSLLRGFTAASIVATGLIVATGSASAASIAFTGSANDGAGSQISVTGSVAEDAGELKFTLEVDGGAGDIRGFFFDVDLDAASLAGLGLSFTGIDVTEVIISKDGVNNLGNGANVNPDVFDIGVEIGTQGANPDFITMTMFNDNGTLALSNLFGQNWAFRATSTGDAQEGSVKITGMFPDDELPPTPDIPEPSTVLLMGGGLLGLGLLRRRIRG